MELRDYLGVLRRRKWVIALCIVVVGGAALSMSLTQSPLYRAEARLLLQPQPSLFASDTTPKLDAAAIQTEIEVIESQPVRVAVAQRLGRQVPGVSASRVGDTSVVSLQADSGRARAAADITNAYAQAYIDYRRKQAVDDLLTAGKEIQAKIDALQRQIDDLSSKLAALPSCATPNQPGCDARTSLEHDRDALVTQQVPFKQKLAELQVDASLDRIGTQVVTPAAVPATPVQPRPLHNGVLGVGVGLVLGVALAFLIEHLDDTIKVSEDLERVVPGLSVLGVIPAVAGWKNRQETRVVSLLEPSSPPAEAYRGLRTSIQFLAIDRSLRVLQVTSPSAAEGKSTTTANLAVALVRAGLSVVVVNCDLRRPRVSQFLRVSNSVGFTSVLLGEIGLSSALQTVPGETRVQVLDTGPLPPNPSELLSSRRTSELLASLKSRFDMVLVDCPPVLPVTDAAVLSSKVDGTLLVATAGVTTQKQVSRAVGLLRQVSAPLLGTVLNGVPVDKGYGYTYHYYRPEPVASNRHAARKGGSRKGGTPQPSHR